MSDVNDKIKESLLPQSGEDERKDTKLGGLFVQSILGGDFLTNPFVRRQARLLVLVMVFIIFYISNRYTVQQQMIDIQNKEDTLQDIKYDALTRSSELMERTRQSRIENYISTQQTGLRTSTNPPYLIKESDDKEDH
jgi:hypothetical protein